MISRKTFGHIKKFPCHTGGLRLGTRQKWLKIVLLEGVARIEGTADLDEEGV